MYEEKELGRWEVPAEDLIDINPIKVRDIITQCFFEAQKETIALTRESCTDEEIHRIVINLLRFTFKEVNEDYDMPTKESLAKVVKALAEKSTSWRTPKHIIEYHMGQVMKVIAALEARR
jgi:hypothetical protein